MVSINVYIKLTFMNIYYLTTIYFYKYELRRNYLKLKYWLNYRPYTYTPFYNGFCFLLILLSINLESNGHLMIIVVNIIVCLYNPALF